jgi:hypothetical protein
MEVITMRVLVIALALCLVVAFAATAKEPGVNLSKTASIGTRSGDAPLSPYFEGFEGAFPPIGWTQVITNPTNTWMRDVDGLYPNAFEGAVAAYIPWQIGDPQDEWLKFTYTIVSGEHVLTFATMGSTYWTVNADFTVNIDGVPIWSFYNDFTGASFTYDLIEIDLSAYIGQTVEIGFRYAGDDGADHYLDAVGLGEGIPRPVNDQCDGSIGIPYGPFEINGSTATAVNDYDPYDDINFTSCTGFAATGPDVVYCVDLKVDEVFEVTMSTGGLWDDSIYLVTDCDDPVNSCVIGDDQYPDGSGFVYTATESRKYYLIVDGYGGGSGDFTITGWNAGGPSANEPTSWGGVKALYR